MFNLIKEFIFGKPAPAPEPAPAPAPVVEVQPAVEVAPYKVELPLVQLEQVAAPVVQTQITDAVTQAPAKKPRKPRAPKAVVEKPAVKKAAPVKKAAAIKAAPKTTRSKKV